MLDFDYNIFNILQILIFNKKNTFEIKIYYKILSLWLMA